MNINQGNFWDNPSSKYVLLAMVIVLSVIIGIMGTVFYNQKASNQNGVVSLESQSSVKKAGSQSQEQQDQSNFISNEFSSFNATVKNIDGNKITLTNLPPSPVGNNTAGEIIVTISEKTEITKVKAEGDQQNVEMSQMPAIPAKISDIKENYSLYVELSKPVDLGGETKTVEAKKIRINGGPGFE